MWSVLTKHLRAKYDAATIECVGHRGFPQHRRSQASCFDGFPSIDTPASGLALWTTPQLGVNILLLVLVTLGKSASLEAIEGNSLVAWVLR